MAAQPTSIRLLINLLHRECAELDGLCSVTLEEQAAVKRLAVGLLPMLNERRLQHVCALQRLEAERLAVAADLAALWGWPGRAVPLSELADRAEPTDGAALRRQHKKMIQAAATARDAMAVTHLALRGLLEVAAQMFDLARNGTPAGGLYAHSGVRTPMRASGTLFVQRG